MPQELPGFYYDEEKNRYFPIKGPIPGSARSSSKSNKASTEKLATSSVQESNACRKLRNRTSKLLLARELYGSVIASPSRKYSFKEEIYKIRASQPAVWKYQRTERIGASALEHMLVDVQTLDGQSVAEVLLAGSISGPLVFCEAGKTGQHNCDGVKCMPHCLRHYANGQTKEHNEMAGPIFRVAEYSYHDFSGISCIRLCQENCSAVGDGLYSRHALFTTLGSEISGGSLYFINLSEPLDIDQSILNMWSRITEVAPFDCTIWTAECDYNRHRSVIGTNLGAASVDLETGRTSWFLRCKSDVFAQQFVNSGNVILCGLRKGAIITVDFRERRERFSSRLVTHRIPYPPDKTVRSSDKEWFKLSGDIYPSHTIRMPSSISCLAALQHDDQYFLASSMDGSIKLYDHRLLQRGAIQSYEGHVNSHSCIQLGVDPAERFVMAGGEDCKLRLWSIKSGELLFEDKLSESVLSTVCYGRYKNSEDKFKHNNLGAWLGSQEGLFYMHWK